MARDRDWPSLLFDVLADPTRRELIRTLDDAGSLDVSAAARELARTEMEASDADRIEVILRHSHAPKMVDAGVIEYDPQAERITAAEMSDVAQELLDLIPTDDPAAEDR